MLYGGLTTKGNTSMSELSYNLPEISMQDLLDAGTHFGHRTMRWNPKMAPYIHSIHNDIHIINLQKTLPTLKKAMQMVAEVLAKNGRLLFVGTKTQASDIVAQAAKSCGQYYVNKRWLGGMLTNWDTILEAIKKLEELEVILEKAESNQSNIIYTKKELIEMSRRRDKIQAVLGGIKDMAGKPDLIFVIDVGKEHIAVKEAKKLGIPVIAIVDTNCNPDNISCVIPGNDDASRALRLYCDLIARSAIAGIQASLIASGIDIGENDDIVSIMANNKSTQEKKIDKNAKKPPNSKKFANNKKPVKAPKITMLDEENDTKPVSKKADESDDKSAVISQ